MKKQIFVLASLVLTGVASAQIPDGYETLDGYQPLESISGTQATRLDATTVSPAYPLAGNGIYEAVRGASLRQTLQRWAQVSGWQDIVWKLPNEADYTLGASARFKGDFLSATRALIDALGPEANLRVSIHHPNRVVVVEQM